MNSSTRIERAAAEQTARAASVWLGPLVCLALAVGAVLWLYQETLGSMVAIWRRSETFAHGFLIAPISAWLIYRERDSVRRHSPRVDARAVPVLAVVGLIWLIARIAGVLVAEQYALVSMLSLLAWLFLGWRTTRALAFPLGFLFLAVPNGDFLMPPLMDLTADLTTTLLRVTGIPVYREGTFFSIPSGDWSVVEGCSGLRYLIATITLGVLYAYLSYRSLWRRLLFMALALTFPVIANGLRAYLIVMIAHLSDMRLALGIDHYLYGWVFYGLVMLLLFAVGGTFAERPSVPAVPLGGSGESAAPPPRYPFGALALALALVVIWPVRAAYLDRLVAAPGPAPELRLPDSVGRWQGVAPLTDWMPAYQEPDAELEQSYSDGHHTVTLYVLYYQTQRQGAELISSRNTLVRQKHAVWRMPEERPVAVGLEPGPKAVLQGRLLSPRQMLMTWRWHRLGSVHTISAGLGKLVEARDKLLGDRHAAVGIVVATELEDDRDAAAAVLQDFLKAALPSLETRLHGAEVESQP